MVPHSWIQESLEYCPGYDIKLRPVVEFRRGIMRLPFATTTSGSPLSKV